MIISLEWLKKYTDIALSTKEIEALVGARLVEIEGVEDLSAKYKDVVIAKIVSAHPIEDTDHLNLTKIDDGGRVKDIERDASGYVQVVCGAPNVREGMMVAWLPPKATVPATFHDAEPFVLGAKELRGYKSNGMLASAQELALYDDHSGIIEVDSDAAPGASFAEVYKLNDQLLDIENKSLTHRPDTFGIIGFAREMAGIQGLPFTTPSWLMDLVPTIENDASVETPTVTIHDPELSDRFSAIVLGGVNEAARSPLDIQTYLSRSGVRPISAVVDVTNYLMLLTGQPMHAYDYDKVLKVSGGSADIHVRSARKGETLKLLDGKVLKLDTEDIVIAAGETAIGLGGAMGGADTEIDDSTKRILLECATFNLYKLRNMQMRHGIFTEAITRLTKGIPAPLSAPVLAEAVRMLSELAGASAISGIAEDYPGKRDAATISVDSASINEILGTQFALEDIQEILENVEFYVEVVDGLAHVSVPYWRQDIHAIEDLAEEIGRLSGFDMINLTTPARDFMAVMPSHFEQLRSKIRNTLVRSGANEVLTYSFVHGDLMRRAGQDPEKAYRLTNSLSPELQYYRQSIVPSLLQAVHPNAKAGYEHFALFEFNKFHTKIHELTEENVPKELDSLGFVLASTRQQAGDAYYEARRYVDYIAETLGLEFVYEPLEEDADYPVTQPFEYRRSARIWDAKTRERIGVVGEFKKSVQKSFKLPAYSAGFEIGIRSLQKLTQDQPSHYVPLSKYPGSERDVCFQVKADVTYQQIVDTVRSWLEKSDLITSLSPVDIYAPADADTKNITVRISVASYEKTLSGEEVNELVQSVSALVVKAHDATII